MSYHAYQPIDPRDAFAVRPRRRTKKAPGAAEDSASVAASQAAFLLAVRSGVMGHVPTTEKLKDFPLPQFEALRRDHHVKVDDACRYLGLTRRELRQEEAPQLEQEMTRAARDVYEKPSIEAAAALFEAGMRSPHPLVAVAAAAGARETTRLRPRIRQTLEKASRSRDRLISRLALTAISHIAPMEDLAARKVVKRPKSRKRRRKSDTAVVTHGTFAANADWYRPGGDFYEALKARRPDLHVHDRSFRWTGAYSKKARLADAQLLKQWISDQGLGVPDFFAHSHGGTVAHLATHKHKDLAAANFERLVLMGWPVHKKWYPDFSKVKRIVDVRVKLDLVIMLDFGRQRFRPRGFRVDEHRNGWFDHSSTREAAYWDDHGLWDVL